MQVAALYDIHGNLPALEALLRDVHRENVDLVVVGGDVFPGPMPRETLACLLSLDVPVRFIHGNGDREVARPNGGHGDRLVPHRGGAVREPDGWSARQLDAEQERRLGRGLRHFIWRSTEQAKYFCHAAERHRSVHSDDCLALPSW